MARRARPTARSRVGRRRPGPRPRARPHRRTVRPGSGSWRGRGAPRSLPRSVRPRPSHWTAASSVRRAIPVEPAASATSHGHGAGRALRRSRRSARYASQLSEPGLRIGRPAGGLVRTDTGHDERCQQGPARQRRGIGQGGSDMADRAVRCRPAGQRSRQAPRVAAGSSPTSRSPRRPRGRSSAAGRLRGSRRGPSRTNPRRQRAIATARADGLDRRWSGARAVAARSQSAPAQATTDVRAPSCARNVIARSSPHRHAPRRATRGLLVAHAADGAKGRRCGRP